MSAPLTLSSRTCLRSVYLAQSCNTIHYPAATRRTNTTLTTSLHDHLLSRKIPIIYDYLNPTPSHLLNISLADIFTSASSPTTTTTPTSSSSFPATRPSITLPRLDEKSLLPPTHHLIYFPPAIPAASLLPDGTDPLQSPGPPFTRRMWAGGSLRINAQRPLSLNGQRAACWERIVDVTVKGKEGDEKVFVGMERRVGLVQADETDEDVRTRFLPAKEGQELSGELDGEWSAIERRNLVFMREAAAPKSPSSSASDATKPKPNKILQPPTTHPDFTHSFTPDPRLLFRYSALTWNAHAIHLDSQFVRDVEGHRGLLVHGPLSFTLLVTNLRRFLAMQEAAEEVEFVEYRNLAPLYAGEVMKVAGRRKEEGKWEVWAEGPDGGVAVRGVVRTRRVEGAQMEDRGGYGDLKMLMGA